MSRGSLDVRIFFIGQFPLFHWYCVVSTCKKIRTPRYIRDCWCLTIVNDTSEAIEVKGSHQVFNDASPVTKKPARHSLPYPPLLHRKFEYIGGLSKIFHDDDNLMSMFRGATNSWKKSFSTHTGHCPCNLPFSVNYALSLRGWTWIERVHFF